MRYDMDEELNNLFSNRAVVAQALFEAQELAIQTDDGNGKTLTLEEQIAFAQSQLSASDELADNYLKNTDSS